MGSPLKDKAKLWLSRNRGLKSRVLADVKKPVAHRQDVKQLQVRQSVRRGNEMQKLRLKYYPSIDIPYNKLFSGKIKGTLGDAEDKLVNLGFRNDPTAYVEVTKEYGPDNGSFSKQYISETGGRIDIPRVTQQPTFWKRTKEQVHTTCFEVGDEIHFCTHKELSAWLEPARHVFANDVSARQGVQQFRWMWFNEYDEELGGKNDIHWKSEY